MEPISPKNKTTHNDIENPSTPPRKAKIDVSKWEKLDVSGSNIAKKKEKVSKEVGIYRSPNQTEILKIYNSNDTSPLRGVYGKKIGLSDLIQSDNVDPEALIQRNLATASLDQLLKFNISIKCRLENIDVKGSSHPALHMEYVKGKQIEPPSFFIDDTKKKLDLSFSKSPEGSVILPSSMDLKNTEGYKDVPAFKVKVDGIYPMKNIYSVKGIGKELTKLKILDLLTGQGDRNYSSLFIENDKLKVIDHDFSFGKKPTFPSTQDPLNPGICYQISSLDCQGFPLVIDTDIQESVLQIDGGRFLCDFNKIGSEEKGAFKERVEILQKALNKQADILTDPNIAKDQVLELRESLKVFDDSSFFENYSPIFIKPDLWDNFILLNEVFPEKELPYRH